MLQRVGHLDSRLSSKGCFSCIRMKVKVNPVSAPGYWISWHGDLQLTKVHQLQCDETRPHCKRCLNGHRQCPGYRKSATTFALETGSAKTFLSSSPPAIAAPLATDWVQNAVSHYFHHFVLDPVGDLAGLHEDVPRLYAMYPNKTYLQCAVQATAMANLARVNGMDPDGLLRALRLRGEAMHGLRVALDDDAERGSATVLMTTDLLLQYDVRLPTLHEFPRETRLCL